MPAYEFFCEKCNNHFENIFCKVGQETAVCKTCNEEAKRGWKPTAPRILTRNLGAVGDFEVRAAHNMEKAKMERAAAEKISPKSPYSEINDFDTKGVFDKDGADNDKPIRMVVPRSTI